MAVKLDQEHAESIQRTRREHETELAEAEAAVAGAKGKLRALQQFCDHRNAVVKPCAATIRGRHCPDCGGVEWLGPDDV